MIKFLWTLIKFFIGIPLSMFGITWFIIGKPKIGLIHILLWVLVFVTPFAEFLLIPTVGLFVVAWLIWLFSKVRG